MNPSPAERDRRTFLALAGITAVALAVRLWGLTFGLPLVRARPDELMLIGAGIKIVGGNPNPDFFDYPALHMYVLAALYSVYYAWGLVTGAFASSADFVKDFRIHWEPFFLIGRATAAAMGTATVVVMFGLGRQLFGRLVGLLSAFFLALAFLHVSNSHYGTTDIPMVFFLMASMLAIARVQRCGRRDDARLAGVLAGCAAATKYNAVLLAVPMLAVAILHAWDRRDRWRDALRESPLLWMAGPFMLTFLALNPYLILDADRAAHHLALLQDSMSKGMTPPHVLGLGWTYHLPFSLRHGLGWPLLATGLAGLLWGAARYPGTTLMLASFPVAYYLVAGAGYNVFVRYMVPVVPFLCVFAAMLVRDVAAMIGRERHAARTAAAAMLAILIVGPSARSVVLSNTLLARDDSRLVAGRWINEHVPAGSSLYSTGNIYGHVQPERPGTRKYRYLDFDRQAGVFTEGGQRLRDLPDWIVVQRSALPYSHIAPAVAALVDSEYILMHVVRAVDLDEPGNVYDIQDGFYLPFGGFKGVRRPGPNLEIYRRAWGRDGV